MTTDGAGSVVTAVNQTLQLVVRSGLLNSARLADKT